TRFYLLCDPPARRFERQSQTAARLRAQAPRIAGIAGGRLGAVRFPSRLTTLASATTRASATPGAVFWVFQTGHYSKTAASYSAISPPERYSTSVPEWDRQFRLVRVHHEHREELGRLSLAGIGADAVAVAGQLREALSGLVGRHRFIVDLTADLPLKDSRIDEGGFGMRVTRRVAARPVFDEHGLDALAGNVRQLVLVDEGHLGVLRLLRFRE